MASLGIRSHCEQLVADAANGDEPLRPARPLLDLPPQVGDVDVARALVADVRRVPEVLHDLAAGGEAPGGPGGRRTTRPGRTPAAAENGLGTWSSAPASRPSTRSTSASIAVRIRIGTSLSSRSRRQISIPESPGRRTSRTRTSYPFPRAASRADSPSAKVSTSKPEARR